LAGYRPKDPGTDGGPLSTLLGKLWMDINRKAREDSANWQGRVPAIGQIYRANCYPPTSMGKGPGEIHSVYGNSGALAKIHSLLRFDLLERCIRRGLPDSFFPALSRKKVNSPNRLIAQPVSISKLYARFSWFQGLVENKIGNYHATHFLLAGGYGKPVLNQYFCNSQIQVQSSYRKETTSIAEAHTFLPTGHEMTGSMEKAIRHVPDAWRRMMGALPLPGHGFRISEMVTRKEPAKEIGTANGDMEGLPPSDVWKDGRRRTEMVRLPWTFTRGAVKETMLSRWSITSKWPSVSMVKRSNLETGFNVLNLVKNRNALRMDSNLNPVGGENGRDEVTRIRHKAQRAMEEILHEIVPTRERVEAVEVQEKIERMEGMMTGLVNQQRQQLEEVRQLKSGVQTMLQELGKPKTLESSAGVMRPLSLRGRL
jgi:hypothetical protein